MRNFGPIYGQIPNLGPKCDGLGVFREIIAAGINPTLWYFITETRRRLLGHLVDSAGTPYVLYQFISNNFKPWLDVPINKVPLPASYSDCIHFETT